MLEKNPAYQIYKNGKIPVIRYKKDGFTNFVQDNYFTQNGSYELDKKFENIVGCFCILGGIQDSFILSGVKDTDTLWLGYIEPDTQIYDPMGQSYVIAEKYFNEALNFYNKVFKNRDEKEKIFNDILDDFDIFYTQAIIKAEDIKEPVKYERKDFSKLWDTLDGGIFKMANVIDFYYTALNNGETEDFLKYIENIDALDIILPLIIEDVPDEILNKYPVLKEYKNLYMNASCYQNKMILESCAPKKMDEYLDKFLKLKNVLKQNKFSIYPKNGKYECYLTLTTKNEKTHYRFSLENKEPKLYKLQSSIDTQGVLLDYKQIVLDEFLVSKLSKIVKELKILQEFDEKATITGHIADVLPKLDDFYKNNEIYLNEEGFTYFQDDFRLDYNYYLDDAVIKDFFSDDEKLLHEEDIILNRNDKKFILDEIYEFRKILNEQKEQALER